LRGAAAGAIAAAMVALLAAVTNGVALRFIFLALDKPLVDMLTFAIQPIGLGILCLIALGALLGIVGVLLVALPDQIRRPLSFGVIGAGLAGLFQELIRPILANSSVSKPLHDLLYTYTGLRLRGALIIFAVVALVIVIRDRNRSPIEASLD